MKYGKIIMLALLLISIGCFVVIYRYPTGNWIAGPAIMLFIASPMLCAQFALTVLYFSGNRKGWVVIMQCMLTLFAVLLMINHIRGNPY